MWKRERRKFINETRQSYIKQSINMKKRRYNRKLPLFFYPTDINIIVRHALMYFILFPPLYDKIYFNVTLKTLFIDIVKLFSSHINFSSLLAFFYIVWIRSLKAWKKKFCHLFCVLNVELLFFEKQSDTVPLKSN